MKLLLTSVCVMAGLLCLFSCHSSEYYPISDLQSTNEKIIPFKDYSKYANHPRPFVVTSKNYVLFGATHTNDPQDPQLKLIEDKWKQLQPTVALIEGKPGLTPPSFIDPVKELGENGKVADLARIHDVPVYSWDIPKEELAKLLAKHFSPEQVALALILNPYFSNLRFGKPASPEDFIEDFFDRAAYVNQQNNIKSAEDIDRIWKKYFPTSKNWREVSDEYELPGYLSDMQTVSNDLRNQQLLVVIQDLLSKNEKVFVISGSSHAVCIKPALAKN